MKRKEIKEKLSQIQATKRGKWMYYTDAGKVFIFEVTSTGERFGHVFEVDFENKTLTPKI